MTPWRKLYKTAEGTLKNGAGWFFLTSALPPVMTVLLGPFVLKKVGLDGYALLSLATYFFSIISGYSDFSAQTHLLTVFSKRSPGRTAELGNAFMLRFVLLALFFAVLLGWSQWKPRPDGLHAVLALFMLSIPVSPGNLEWYLISRKRYFHVFIARAVAVLLQTGLVLAWLFTGPSDARVFAGILVVSSAGGLASLLWLLGGERIRMGAAAVRAATARGVANLVVRLAPMSASLLVTPYFLAYAFPWYSLTQTDKALEGSFSIAYRLIMGILALTVPLVVYVISQNGGSDRKIAAGRTFRLALSAAAVFWMLGVPVLWLYFHVSRLEPGLFLHSLKVFSILMAGLFLTCLRAPYLGRWILQGRYGMYFLVLAGSCAPVLLASWLLGSRFPSEWVAWGACVPDLLTTLVFMAYDPGRRAARASVADTEASA